MDEYISKQEAVKEIKSRIVAENDRWDSGYNTAMAEIMLLLIKHIPAADVQPVKHGRWIENSDPGQNINEHYMCSVCGSTFHNWANDNYCPNCGSKNRMDGDSE